MGDLTLSDGDNWFGGIIYHKGKGWCILSIFYCDWMLSFFGYKRKLVLKLYCSWCFSSTYFMFATHSLSLCFIFLLFQDSPQHLLVHSVSRNFPQPLFFFNYLFFLTSINSIHLNCIFGKITAILNLSLR